MSEDPILCFQHCESGPYVLCLQCPSSCPCCCKALENESFNIPPFRLGSPLADSTYCPFSVVLKPTSGSFLHNYSKGCDLHIGITNSLGVVYDFDRNGVNIRPDGWVQCLVVLTLELDDWMRRDSWDLRLEEYSTMSCWRKESYSEVMCNCYDYVLGFLSLMNLQAVVPSITDKLSSNFCRDVVVPQTKRVAKYISLYRRLLREETVVQYHTSL